MDTTPETETGTGIEPEVGTVPAEDHSKLSRWIGNFALGGAILAAVIAILSLTLARYGVIGKLPGFIGFMMLLNPLRALALIALVGIVIAAVRKSGIGWRSPLALVISLVMLGVMYTQVIIPAGNAPRLHDITTNVDDPPQFTRVQLREDNLIPFNNIGEWQAAHREGYPDIQPVVINRNPDRVLADARALAESKGWTIVSVDNGIGQMEATAYAGYIRFMDDVVIKVTPIADGSTRVDMRSVSRVGLSDLGYNAKRIREFLAELRAS